jgi:hypothetical protein
LNPATLHASVSAKGWLHRFKLATEYLARIRSDSQFSARFSPCLNSLELHLADTRLKVDLLAV